jgi:lipopolysaccharide transport system ATP-binding protein
MLFVQRHLMTLIGFDGKSLEMAAKAAIRFEGVSKKFVLQQERPRSFQEAMLNLLRWGGNGQREEFWALRDVSFEIGPGETMGFIGPNGAGKSTALKLISRILEPTEGQVKVQGKVGALLELGVGFHPDLTGRENIFLKSSMLGVSRAQIQQKLDQIIAFAELERFIDVPVKHYSSGMAVRLGFAVAVQVEPDILLIDEVLAVGDQNFQHKCLEHIRWMQRQGITICFVSHGLERVRQLCSHAVWLDKGCVRAAGDVGDTISAYLRYATINEESRITGTASKRGETPLFPPTLERGGVQGPDMGPDGIEIAGVSFLNEQGEEQRVFRVGEPWTVQLRYRAHRKVERPVFGLTIRRDDNLHVCGTDTHFEGLDIPLLEGDGDILYRVANLPLMEGSYLLSVSSYDKTKSAAYDHHCPDTFKVRQVESGERYGLMSMGGEWEWDDQTSLPSSGRSLEKAAEVKRAKERRGEGEKVERRWGTGDVEIVTVSFLDASGKERRVFEVGEFWSVYLHYRAQRRIDNPVFGLAVFRDDGLHMCGPNTQFAGMDIPFIGGEGIVLYRVARLPLMEGTYLVSVAAHNQADTVMFDYQDRLYSFKVCQFEASEQSGAVNIVGEWKWSNQA